MAPTNVLEKQVISQIEKQVMSQKGVIGLIIINHDGVPIKTTMDNSTTVLLTMLFVYLYTDIYFHSYS